MDKILDLKRRAEALKQFTELPRSISHDKLRFYPNGEYYWTSPSRNIWTLKLEAVDGSCFTMHKNNTGYYRLAYVLDGWDGEEQALPFRDDEMNDMIKHGILIYSGGIYGNDLGNMIARMKKWIDKEIALAK